jgi:hypothetical protein
VRDRAASVNPLFSEVYKKDWICSGTKGLINGCGLVEKTNRREVTAKRGCANLEDVS